MLKIGVLGAGHLGKIHLKLLNQSEKFELIGFYDENPEVRNSVSKEFGYNCFDSFQEMLSKVDVVDIVTPTPFHFENCMKAIEAGKHFFVEKPITETVQEAKQLITAKEKTNIKAQVGHVERFNPAFLSVKNVINKPKFIEIHRLAEFNPRGTDVSVVLDLMIHDIDILLSIVKSKVKNIVANGVPVISQSPDITNARIEFENGCVANITTSRISMKNMRKARIFQKDAYITVDFLEKKSEIIRMKTTSETADPYAMVIENAEGEKKQILFENPKVTPTNAILEELETFADAINNKTTPRVTLNEATEALELCHKISELL